MSVRTAPPPRQSLAARQAQCTSEERHAQQLQYNNSVLLFLAGPSFTTKHTPLQRAKETISVRKRLVAAVSDRAFGSTRETARPHHTNNVCLYKRAVRHGRALTPNRVLEARAATAEEDALTARSQLADSAHTHYTRRCRIIAKYH